MKKHTKFFSVVIILFMVIPVIHGQSVKKTTLLTIGEGEEIAYGESCIPFSATKDNLYVVTKKGADIFVYENGRKTGPFKSFDDANIKDCGNPGRASECATYEYEGGNDIDSWVSYNDDGNMVIKFKGKTFGPYAQVYSFTVSEDKQSFTAIVAGNDTKNHMINSSGANYIIDGIPSDVTVSPSAKKVIYTISIPPDESYMKAVNELSKTNFDNMTPEEIQKFTEKVQKSAINSYQEKVYLLTSDNRKFGPYIKDSITGPQFCKTGGDNWYILIGDKMYVNGKEYTNFKAPTAAPCDIWLSGDGKRYAALVNYDKILFSDGTSYPFPLEITSEKVNGRAVLKWISFENNKDIVLYSKPL